RKFARDRRTSAWARASSRSHWVHQDPLRHVSSTRAASLGWLARPRTENTGLLYGHELEPILLVSSLARTARWPMECDRSLRGLRRFGARCSYLPSEYSNGCASSVCV